VGLSWAVASPSAFAWFVVVECGMAGMVLGMYAGAALGAVSGLIFGASRGAGLAAELAGTRRADLGALAGAIGGAAAAAGVLLFLAHHDPGGVSPWLVVGVGAAATALGALLGQELALMLDREPTRTKWQWTPSVSVSRRGAPMVAVAGRF
jgi:ABC-type Fe3+-siderophore transport system permease subunit